MTIDVDVGEVASRVPDDLRALAEKLALEEFSVERQAGLPSIALRGIR